MKSNQTKFTPSAVSVFYSPGRLGSDQEKYNFKSKPVFVVLGLTKLTFKHSPFGWGSTPTASLQRDKTLPTSVLDMTKNIWWWGSSFGDLRNVEYPFNTITPRPILTKSCNTK